MALNKSDHFSQLKENKLYQIVLTSIIMLCYILLGEYLPIGSYSTFAGAVITVVLIYFWGKLEGQTFVETTLTSPGNWPKE